jgi:protease I
MRPFLESETLHAYVARHVKADRPLGAICHGVLVVARARDGNGSVLRGRTTTALPASMELSAWALTCMWLGNYYRTYKEIVQAEVSAAIGEKGRFVAGPKSLRRDDPDHLERGFTVRDGNYLSARWPGDAYRFAHEFLELLESHDREGAATQAG